MPIASPTWGILVELAPEAQRLITEIYGPIGQEGQAALARYSAADLRLLRDSLRAGRALQAAHAAHIRNVVSLCPEPGSASPGSYFSVQSQGGLPLVGGEFSC